MHIALWVVGGLIALFVLLIVAICLLVYFLSPKVTEADFLTVLKVDSWMAGYDITKAIDRLKGLPEHGFRGLSFGTTYEWMDSMQQKGLVERKDELQHGRNRAFFRLTVSGATAKATMHYQTSNLRK